MTKGQHSLQENKKQKGASCQRAASHFWLLFASLLPTAAAALFTFALTALIFTSAAASTCAASCPAGGEHEYTVNLNRQATDTEDGLRTYTCSKCGESYQEVIPKTGHKWSGWKVTDPATCTTKGIEERTCTQCGRHEQRYIKAKGHNYELSGEHGATCIEAGYREYRCSRCGDSYTEAAGEALGHDWGEWHEEDGMEVRICQRDPSHREERLLRASDTESEPEPEKKKKSDPEPATEPDSEESPSWTAANTAVAVAGTGILAGLGASIYTLYLTPWLWILVKRKKKGEELRREMLKKL